MMHNTEQAALPRPTLAPVQRLLPLSCLAITALFVYVLALSQHTVNWPFTDDYLATLQFLIDWQTRPALLDRLERILAPHNEHRLVLNHVFELIDLTAFGQVSFAHMVVIGNFLWASAVAAMLWQGRHAGLSWGELSPAIILGCTLSHHDLMIWAMASLQQYGQILLCVLAAWAASRDKWLWSLIAAVMAAAAGGGGFAVFPAVAICFAARRHWMRAGATLVLMCLLLLAHAQSLSIAQAEGSRIQHALQHPLQAAAYALCFLGSVGKSTQASIALGLLTVLSLGWLMWREDAIRRQPFFVIVCLWLLFSAALAALARLSLGVDQARSTRYTPHAITLLMSIGMLSVSLARTTNQRQIRWRCWATLCLILWLTWLGHGWRQQAQQAEALRMRTHIAPPSAEVAHQILEDARRAGVFQQ